MDAAWIAVAGAAAIAFVAWNALRAKRRGRDRRELKEQVQAWEDEGGNVPEVPTAGPGPRAASRDGKA